MHAATLCATPTWLPSPPPTIPHLILPDIASTLEHNDRLLRLRRNETSGPFGSPQVGRSGALVLGALSTDEDGFCLHAV